MRDDDERRQFARFGAGIHLDGALLVSFAADDAFPETLETAGVPVVAAGRGRFVRYSVDVDNRGGARRAVERLIAGGRRHIATIAGPGELAVINDRLAGWRDALPRRGARSVDRGLVEVGDYGQAVRARRRRSALLERAPDIDGLFAASDLMAFGALEALAGGRPARARRRRRGRVRQRAGRRRGASRR